MHRIAGALVLLVLCLTGCGSSDSSSSECDEVRAAREKHGEAFREAGLTPGAEAYLEMEVDTILGQPECFDQSDIDYANSVRDGSGEPSGEDLIDLVEEE